jgi:hypothetical protein
MVLNIIITAAFAAFLAGAVNNLPSITPRAIASSSIQWVGALLIAAAAISGAGPTALYMVIGAAIGWTCWNAKPTAIFGGVLGAVIGAMNAPVVETLRSVATLTGAQATMLGMLGICGGFALSTERHAAMPTRLLRANATAAITAVRSQGLQLTRFASMRTNAREATERLRATTADKRQAPKRPKAAPVVKAEVVEEAASAARAVGQRRFRRSRSNAADAAMLEKISNKAAKAEAAAPQEAVTQEAVLQEAVEVAPVAPEQKPKAKRAEQANDDAVFAEIVDMLRNEA